MRAGVGRAVAFHRPCARVAVRAVGNLAVRTRRALHALALLVAMRTRFFPSLAVDGVVTFLRTCASSARRDVRSRTRSEGEEVAAFQHVVLFRLTRENLRFCAMTARSIFLNARARPAPHTAGALGRRRRRDSGPRSSRGGGFTRAESLARASRFRPGLVPLVASNLASTCPAWRTTRPGILRGYVCDHNAAPPAHQYITTDKTNVLIRALTQKRSKDALAGRGAVPRRPRASRPRRVVRSHPETARAPGVESRRAFLSPGKKRFAFETDAADAADASARRPRPPAKRAKRAHTETRVAHENLTADQPSDQPSSPTSRLG